MPASKLLSTQDSRSQNGDASLSPPALSGPALLTIDEVCSMLRLSRRSVYRKIGAGELPVIRLGDGPSAHLRVPEDGRAAD
jgi:excisionase family DNA binding protein